MKSLAQSWQKYPQIRFLARTVVVAGATYLIAAFGQGNALDWNALGYACATAGLTALVGLLTPVEPFVGPDFAKANKVEVPKPPAKTKPKAA